MTQAAPWPAGLGELDPALLRLVTLRHNPRARRLTLRADPARRQITCTVPEGLSPALIARFLRDQADWIRCRSAAFPAPPLVIDGAVIPVEGQDLTIRLTGRDGRSVSRVQDSLLVPSGPVAPQLRLRRHLEALARARLTPLVHAKAQLAARTVSHVTFNDPKTRWGSCSAHGRISLSWRLILAPPVVADYVVAHEVAHLCHLNHSAAFWRVAARLADDMDAAKAWLRQHGASLHGHC